VSPLQRAKESFLSPAKAGSQIERDLLPTLESVGYGSYAGFADGCILPHPDTLQSPSRDLRGGYNARR
jgi:hypothetical protein